MKPPEENWCDPGFGGEIFSYETRSTWFPKGNPSWIFIGRTDAEAETPNTLATSCKKLTHWKRLWCWEGLGAGEGDDRGWDGWMASPTQWTWVWVNSGSWWWTGRRAVIHGVAKSWTWLSDWTEVTWSQIRYVSIRGAGNYSSKGINFSTGS